MADRAGGAPQSLRFLLLYALAAAGGAVAYVPFLTVLLPVKVQTMFGAEAVSALAYIAFAGAIAASLANIGFGWLSDRTGTRRPWIAAGLVLSSALLMAMSRADSLTLLIALVVAWQLALNMMLGPLSAWAGDCVPDGQKGLLGGLLSIAPALGALSGTLVTVRGMAGADERLALVAAMVVALVVPVLLFGGSPRRAELMVESAPRERAVGQQRGMVARMWLARLLVQISEAALFAYLLLWLAGIDVGFGDDDTARLFGAVVALSVPLALAAGRWSDRARQPFLPLAIAAGGAAAGLVVMAVAPGLGWAIAGYVAFGIATSVFLALHSAQTLRVLPRPATRGRDLGLFNLTNTVPSLVMPLLTLALVPAFGFGALFALLAALAASACAILLRLPRPN